jgi:hypothetical protein
MYMKKIFSILELMCELTCAFACHSDGAALGVVLTTLLNHSYTHKCREEGTISDSGTTAIHIFHTWMDSGI